MAGRSVRMKCRDCRKVAQGTPGRTTHCDNCGGELVTLRYGPRRKAGNGGRSSGR